MFWSGKKKRTVIVKGPSDDCVLYGIYFGKNVKDNYLVPEWVKMFQAIRICLRRKSYTKVKEVFQVDILDFIL